MQYFWVIDGALENFPTIHYGIERPINKETFLSITKFTTELLFFIKRYAKMHNFSVVDLLKS